MAMVCLLKVLLEKKIIEFYKNFGEAPSVSNSELTYCSKKELQNLGEYNDFSLNLPVSL